MERLEDLKTGGHEWGLDEFVTVANELLPGYIGARSSDARVKSRLSARLVRAYTSQGLLDEPVRDGKRARYTYRHLLQALVVRRLLSDGMNTTAIGERLPAMASEELEELLQGGVQVELAVANPALAFLRKVQEREQEAPAAAAGAGASNRSAATPPAPHGELTGSGVVSNWTRVEVIDGLEIHVRDGLRLPGSRQERETLLSSIEAILREHSEQARKRKGGSHGED